MRHLKDRPIEQALRCPLCGEAMAVCTEGSGSLLCLGARRHRFDLSASGYVNFALPGQSAGGDSKQAVRARSEFLNGGYYAPVSEALCGVLKNFCRSDGGILIDAGCGEGYYTAGVAEQGFSTLGVDLSKFAVDAAAKRVRRMGLDHSFFAVGSVFSLPVADGCAQGVINLFAPCAEKEFCRVLQSDGRLIVAHAGPDHLMGLKKAMYDVPRGNEERADLPKKMRLVEEKRVQYTICVDGQEAIQSLFAMTPYYWRTSREDSEKLSRLSSLQTEVDVILSLYQKDSKKETV